MRYRPSALFAVFAGFALVGCATLGRRVDLARFDSEESLPAQDRKLWRMSAHEHDHLRTAGLLYSDSLLTDYLQEVGMRLVPDDLQNSIVPFTFHVVLDPEPNAFSLPNGRVFVHLGLLSYLDNESQLAHVLGHEIAHVVNRDAVSSYTHQKNVIVTTYILSWTASRLLHDRARESLWWLLLSTSLQTSLRLAARATISGHGLDAEVNADQTALDYMWAAGYDVDESPRVLDNPMNAYASPSGAPAFFLVDRQHLQSRRENLRACLMSPREKRRVPAPPSGAARRTEEYRRRTDLARR